MDKDTTKQPQTLEFSPKCSSFLLYIIFKTLMFIRFGDPFCTRSIWRVVVFWERNTYDLKHIWLCIVYLYCPVQWGRFLSKDSIMHASTQTFSILSSSIFLLSLIVIIIIGPLINILWLIYKSILLLF